MNDHLLKCYRTLLNQYTLAVCLLSSACESVSFPIIFLRIAYILYCVKFMPWLCCNDHFMFADIFCRFPAKNLVSTKHLSENWKRMEEYRYFTRHWGCTGIMLLWNKRLIVCKQPVKATTYYHGRCRQKSWTGIQCHKIPLFTMQVNPWLSMHEM